MIITQEISDLSECQKPVHLAMGVFDGVHAGHQEVIQRACDEARKAGALCGVLTFDPFPLQVVAPDRAPQKILASISHKQCLLAELGVDILLVVPFNKGFSKLSAKEFLDLLYETGRLAHISIGEDWKFGRGREGRLAFLEDYCAERGILLSAAAPVIHQEERISSTRIRQCVRDGNLRAAAEMLGRPYSLFGDVVEGDQLGRKIGFPTANVDTQNELLPPNGVYVVRAEVRGEMQYGVANLGLRPTVTGKGVKTLEVHFLDFKDDIYGENLHVELGQCLRPEKKFDGIDALKAQIAKDCESARSLIDSHEAWYK